MLRNFYPYAYVNDMFHIDYAALYQQGYRAIIFDIDNTLVHHRDDANQEIIDLFRGWRRLVVMPGYENEDNQL